jgi:hypothetical protein
MRTFALIEGPILLLLAAALFAHVIASLIERLNDWVGSFANRPEARQVQRPSRPVDGQEFGGDLDVWEEMGVAERATALGALMSHRAPHWMNRTDGDQHQPSWQAIQREHD